VNTDIPVSGVRYLSHPPGSGQGDSAQEYLSGLRSAAVPVSWSPLAWGTGTWGPGHGLAPITGHPAVDYQHSDICNIALECDTTIVHSTPLWNEAWECADRSERHIAYTTFEADRLPGQWVTILNKFDAVLVPSQQNLQMCQASGVTVPVTVVPHIARPHITRPHITRPHSVRPHSAAPGTELIAVPDGVFVFYLIGTWTSRKAVPDAIRAFLSAFTAADDVALVIKTTREDRVALERIRQGREPDPGQYSGQSWFSLARLLAGYDAPPPIRLITRDVPAAGIRQLHTRGDCFVSLARGEAWGLGAFEAGIAGNPVVVTGWGGQLDYLPSEYPFCVDYELVPTVDDEPDDWFEFAPDQRWARADIAHAGALLRDVYEHRGPAREWGRQLQQHILGNFTSDRVMPRLLRALSLGTTNAAFRL
jgi:glycosyltransferase involved in cell wall biosynthesis